MESAESTSQLLHQFGDYKVPGSVVHEQFLSLDPLVCPSISSKGQRLEDWANKLQILVAIEIEGKQLI